MPIADGQRVHNANVVDNRTNKWLLQLPNALTMMRVLVVPVFVVLLVRPSPKDNLLACAIFIVAALTDWLDGYLARKLKAESVFGALFDPLADKLLVMAALIMLAADPQGSRVPAWMVVALLGRDFIISSLRALAASRGIVVAASRLAKHKTAWTMLAITFLLVGAPYEVFSVYINFQSIGLFILWIALCFSIYSGVEYFFNLRGLFSKVE